MESVFTTIPQTPRTSDPKDRRLWSFRDSSGTIFKISIDEPLRHVRDGSSSTLGEEKKVEKKCQDGLSAPAKESLPVVQEELLDDVSEESDMEQEEDSEEEEDLEELDDEDVLPSKRSRFVDDEAQ